MNLLFNLFTLAAVAAIVSSTSTKPKLPIPHPRPCLRAPKGVNSIAKVTLRGNRGWAKYKCIQHFVPIGGKKQLDCVNGRYTSTDALRCGPRPRPCPKAPKGLNAFVRVTTKGNNAWAKYTCKRGFVRFAGRTQLDCVNGRYTSTDALKCRKRVPVCPRAPAGSNVVVRVFPPGSAPNQVAKYQCLSGFVRKSGQKVLKCRNGRYNSHDALRCIKRVVCPKPPKGQNVKVTITGKGANQWAKYRCINKRYRIVGGKAQLDCVNGRYTSTDALRCALVHPRPHY